MADPLVQALAVVAGTALLAFFFAKVEIQIEGPEGWAAKLPTWRIEKHWALDLFFGGRALTGYHAWLLSFMLLVFHLSPLVSWSWTRASEELTMAAFILFWIFEDALWFALNPAWGIRKLSREHVTWHKHWLIGLPVDYWVFAAVSAALLWHACR